MFSCVPDQCGARLVVLSRRRWSGHVVRDIEHCAHGISVNLGGSCLKKWASGALYCHLIVRGRSVREGATARTDGEILPLTTQFAHYTIYSWTFWGPWELFV